LNSDAVKRPYDASRRQAQSRQLRVEVAEAARRLFVERGFAATTIGDVATAAGVSQQFVYAAFGGKRGLLSKVVDWTLAGDDEPIPLAERPSVQAIQQERTTAGKCALHARHIRLLAPRVCPLVRMLRSAADADPDARAIYEAGEQGRRTSLTQFVADLRTAGGLRAGLTDEQAVDAIWSLTPDVLWTALVTRCGWSDDDFEVWYAGQVAAAALDDSQLGAVREFSADLVARDARRADGASSEMPGQAAHTVGYSLARTNQTGA
jgi:AcrR family transcriptional regulator